MSAAAILDDLRQHGAVATLDGGAVRIRAPRGSLPAALVEAAREAKPELVALLTEDARADFEERAAIMEFDGGMNRPAAEAAARRMMTNDRRNAA